MHCCYPRKIPNFVLTFWKRERDLDVSQEILKRVGNAVDELGRFGNETIWTLLASSGWGPRWSNNCQAGENIIKKFIYSLNIQKPCLKMKFRPPNKYTIILNYFIFLLLFFARCDVLSVFWVGKHSSNIFLSLFFDTVKHCIRTE